MWGFSWPSPMPNYSVMANVACHLDVTSNSCCQPSIQMTQRLAYDTGLKVAIHPLQTIHLSSCWYYFDTGRWTIMMSRFHLKNRNGLSILMIQYLLCQLANDLVELVPKRPGALCSGLHVGLTHCLRWGCVIAIHCFTSRPCSGLRGEELCLHQPP